MITVGSVIIETPRDDCAYEIQDSPGTWSR